MTNSSTTSTVSFHRRSELPGVELRLVDNSRGRWQSYSSGFEFIVPGTWQGDVWHRRRTNRLDPNCILCAQPGEALVVERVWQTGSLAALTVDAEILAERLQSLCQGLHSLRLKAVSQLSARLGRAWDDVCRALLHEGPIEGDPLERFLNLVLAEMREDVAPPSSAQWGARAAQRVFERLHDDTASNVDLSTLAQTAGMSRYQTLRAFKRRYGLPPHTYHLSMRIGLAQKALRQGDTPARVAAEQGFVDQSHMTRHFKRLLGITPGQYIRAARH